jgi:hypothetical protein
MHIPEMRSGKRMKTEPAVERVKSVHETRMYKRYTDAREPPTNDVERDANDTFWRARVGSLANIFMNGEG